MKALFPPGHLVSKIGTRFVHHALAPLFARVHSLSADSVDPSSPSLEPIFIIGPPRCGSTIFYQAITNYFDVLYIDNLGERWAKALPYGMERSRRRFGNTPHDNFRAEHGSTAASGGWHAPSECGNLWYRWLPFDQHYVAPEEVTETMVKGLRTEFEFIQRRWNAPLVIKNLHVGQRLAWVSSAFPRARYVCIHRKHEAVASSILRARRLLEVPDGALWSTRPPIYDDLSTLPEKDMVDQQVRRLTHKIEEDLAAFPTGAVHHVRYDDFSPRLIEELGSDLGLVPRPGGSLPDFRTGS